ncbi:MAG TPA: hypothetical protein VFD66_05580, partial [Verrucomicrobiae bacterium]|nr:hypothetical protein [Verrucomicrobiae bacterium]
TLQGHPILSEPWVAREQYDRPLFFHPPGGIALFWLTSRIAGDSGYAMAEVLSFALYFWAVVFLGFQASRPVGLRCAQPDGCSAPLPGYGGRTQTSILLLAILAAFCPLMSQVTGRLWLDGPLLAFSTAAAALFLFGVRRQNTKIVTAAALLLGYASWIKLTAFLAAPGALALAWAITESGQRRFLFTRGLLWILLAGLLHLPWEIWQWHVFGTPFPTWAGKPAAQLVRDNPYVHYLTVVRSPWIYIQLLPQVLWTLVPSVVLLGLQWGKRELRKRGLALLFWIAVVVVFHVTLATMGYSKLLRYVILTAPAALVLFAITTAEVVRTLQDGRWVLGSRQASAGLIVLAATGLALQVIQALTTSLVDNRMIDLIRPLPILDLIFG